jgi:hypothetical protein
VHDTSDFTHAVRLHNGTSFNVSVIRDKKEQNLNLTLPQRKESSDLFEDESFDREPLIRAESALELSQVRDQIAKLRPELEVAAESYRKPAEKIRSSLCDEQKKLREESRKQREELRKQQEELRHQLDRLREDVRRNVTILNNSMDI